MIRLKFCFNKTIIILLLIASLVGKAEAQKGEKSIAAGLLVAFPESKAYMNYESWNTGVGVEGIGQYNFTNKSALLAQLQLTRFSGLRDYGLAVYPIGYTSLAITAGYRYDFSPSGFYAHFLFGIELNEMFTPATLGVGKRFRVNNNFIDAGVEYTGGYITCYNIRAVYSLLRKTSDSQ